MEQLNTIQQVLPLLLSQDNWAEENPAQGVGALRSMIVRNVSHELRTPLGIVLGYAELLNDGVLGVLAPEQERALAIVVRHLHELHKMVERLSILMAVENGASTRVPLNLAEIVRQIVRKKRAEVERAEIALAASYEPDLPLVSGDVRQLEQAVECLLENALKFTPGGGQIEVEVYAEPGWVCLAVSDTGIGIPEQECERIFSGFYQVDGSTSRQYGGFGLGLTLLKAVAESHGGWVEVESQPGQGSRFLVRLPACGMMLGWIDQMRERFPQRLSVPHSLC